MIRCMIVDDEPLAQQVLEGFVKHTPGMQLEAVCSNALEAFGVLSRQKIDLLLLDIKMPRVSGIDLVRSLKDPPAVIFTTAFGEHAVTGFELEAVDYLVKPVTYERFQKAIRRLLKELPPVVTEMRDHTYFKVSGQLVRIRHDELYYARSIRDYVSLCTKNGNYLTHMTMKYLSELLPEPPFLRVHRSFLINRNFAVRIDKVSVFIGNERIPVGENYRQDLSVLQTKLQRPQTNSDL